MKRCLWTYEETIEMLNVMMEQESLKAMNGRPFRKDKAFSLIHEEMIRRGFPAKDAKQIEYRWKNLKKRFIDIQKDPSLAEGTPFEFYDEIDIMLRGKLAGETNEKNRPYFKKYTKPTEVNDVKTSSSPERTVPSMAAEASSTGVEIAALLPMKSATPVEETHCEEFALERKVVKTEPAEAPQSSYRRSQRSTRGKSRRYPTNKPNAKPAGSSTRSSEGEISDAQKKLIDYQFGLYSRLQRESDENFLQMSRQILEQCNQRFESFVTNLLHENEPNE